MFRRITALTAGAILAATLGLTMASPASATTLPACSATDPGTAPNLAGHCWYTTAPGAAGYLGANDGQTRYRYAGENITNNPQLVNLAGGTNQGLVGDMVCDPNNHAFGNGGWAAQIGLIGNGGTTAVDKNTVFYDAGFWPASAQDPCVTHAPIVPSPDTATNCPPGGTGSVLGTGSSAFCGSFSNTSQPNGEIGLNDLLDNVAVFYVPGGHHFHQISFGYCDITANNCQQAYTHSPVSLNLWETGFGAFAQNLLLTAPANITLEQAASAMVTCYSCAHAVPLGTVQSVNKFGIGGLEEVQMVNSSGQVVMGPNNTLSGTSYTLFNGSTS